MLQLNFGAAALPGAGGGGCTFVDANGVCVQTLDTSTPPQSGGGLVPRRNIFSGTFQMRPAVAATFRPDSAPSFITDPGPVPTRPSPIAQVPQFTAPSAPSQPTPEPQFTTDASTIPGQQVTVSTPASSPAAAQLFPPQAKFFIPKWALALGGLALLGMVIAMLARR